MTQFAPGQRAMMEVEVTDYSKGMLRPYTVKTNSNHFLSAIESDLTPKPEEYSQFRYHPVIENAFIQSQKDAVTIHNLSAELEATKIALSNSREQIHRFNMKQTADPNPSDLLTPIESDVKEITGKLTDGEGWEPKVGEEVECTVWRLPTVPDWNQEKPCKGTFIGMDEGRYVIRMSNMLYRDFPHIRPIKPVGLEEELMEILGNTKVPHTPTDIKALHLQVLDWHNKHQAPMQEVTGKLITEIIEHYEGGDQVSYSRVKNTISHFLTPKNER